MNQQVMTAIIGTAEYYGRQLSEGVLKMYAEDLADLDPLAVCKAYVSYRRNPANRVFPLPAQIREIVAPEQHIGVEARAREIAARIVGGVTKHGWCNGKSAELDIGPEGWALVQRRGGWAHFCQNLTTKQAPIVEAQLREQLHGVLEYGPALEQAIGVGTTRGEQSQLAPPSHSEMLKALIQRGVKVPASEPEGTP